MSDGQKQLVLIAVACLGGLYGGGAFVAGAVYGAVFLVYVNDVLERHQ
jgi:hypothetical protein